MDCREGTYRELFVSYELIIRPEAEAEMEEAFDGYENRVFGLGSDFLRCVDATLNSMARHPLQYRQVHRSVRRAIIRRFPYEIFFIDEHDRIIVMSVFHVRRNPKSWQERI